MNNIDPSLLGRPAVALDLSALSAMIAGRTVMVSGAGGSIGSEICRQLIAHAPGELLLLDNTEYNLFMIERELRDTAAVAATTPPQLSALLADVRDRDHVDHLLARHRPEVVIHASAYKHVPLLESNPHAAVRSNVLGTWNLADASRRCGVERFVLLSSDKAVHPTSIMGATKRICEMICQQLQSLGAAEAGSATRFMAVRFGNVLGSTGSVIPIFQEQIARGGPVTVTHPEMTRYFMSIPEAAQLVLQAGAIGEGGEVFVLNMGEPICIVDLARAMILQSGRTLKEIPIHFTGLRPGEKLYEELLFDDEATLPTSHPEVRVARLRPVAADLSNRLEPLLELDMRLDNATVRRMITDVVPEYQAAVP